MNSAFDDIDWQGGVVFFDDFPLDLDFPLTQQLDILKEDLLQVKYGESLVVDVGWYPEFSEDGELVVYVVESDDWENPLMRNGSKTIDEFMNVLRRGIDLAKNRWKTTGG